MFVGRPISAIAGLLLLIILSRHLSKDEYGIYFAIWALAEIVIFASNFGLINAVYRYISSRETCGKDIIIDGPVWFFVGLRFMFLFPISLAVIFSKDLVSLFLPSAGMNSELYCCIATIIFSEGMARFVESIFDSALSQGRSQLTLIGRTCLRLIGVCVAIAVWQVDIKAVIYIETIATLSGALISLMMLTVVMIRGNKLSAKHDYVSDVAPSLMRMIKYAGPAYLTQLLYLVYGPDTLKLVLGSLVGPATLATFGFAYSLAAVIKRYLPANMLLGVFRPAFVAASKKDSSDKLLSGLFGICIKINFLFIMPCFIVSAFAGDKLLSILSKGKYADAGLILTIILIGLLAVSVHLVLSLYCLAIERSMPTFYASVVSMVCLPISIYMANHYGALGIACVVLFSEVLWCSCCIIVLKQKDLWLSLDYRRMLNVGVATILALCFGHSLSCFGVHLIVQAAISPIFFCFSCYMFNVFDETERSWFVSFFPVLNNFPWRRDA